VRTPAGRNRGLKTAIRERLALRRREAHTVEVRRVLLLATSLLALSASSAIAAPRAHSIPALRFTVTGEIGMLGPARIAIGKVACSIPPKLAVTADRFVIGDPVRMTCSEGRLAAVRYSPELAPAQSDGAVSIPAYTPPPARPSPSGGVSAFTATFGSIVLSQGTATSGTSGALTSATGTVDNLSDSSITVGGLTCSVPAVFMKFPAFIPIQLGWNATLTCRADTGAIAALSARSN
jgi:hypothetical protein